MPRLAPHTLLLATALACRVAPCADAAPDGAVDAAAFAASQPLYAVPTSADHSGRMIAPVYINGAGPFLFMLDTGANRTVLSEQAARRLGLDVNASNVMVQGINGRAAVPKVLVRQLQAGALRFEDVELPVLTGPVLDRIDGILGMDGLAGKKVTADFVRDRITIADSRGGRAPFNRLVMRGTLLSGSLMMIDGEVGHVPVKAIIDTGSMRTLGNLRLQRALAARRGHGELAYTTSVVDATDRLRLGELSVSPQISLGDATISNTVVTYGDFDIFRVWGLEDEPALLIGMDVLGTLAEVAIDYRRQELQLLTRGS